MKNAIGEKLRSNCVRVCVPCTCVRPHQRMTRTAVAPPSSPQSPGTGPSGPSRRSAPTPSPPSTHTQHMTLYNKNMGMVQENSGKGRTISESSVPIFMFLGTLNQEISAAAHVRYVLLNHNRSDNTHQRRAGANRKAKSGRGHFDCTRLPLARGRCTDLQSPSLDQLLHWLISQGSHSLKGSRWER